jgi:hypothetical protein
MEISPFLVQELPHGPTQSRGPISGSFGNFSVLTMFPTTPKEPGLATLKKMFGKSLGQSKAKILIMFKSFPKQQTTRQSLCDNNQGE